MPGGRGPARLQQIAWNLLSNAMKFTPGGGRIQVNLRRGDGEVEFSVSDTGVGIHGDFLPHVFERFRQEDSSITRRYGGLGLGLSIVKQLVELHGGKASVASKGEGRGATFTVDFPAGGRSAVAVNAGHAAEGMGWLPYHNEAFKGLKILVVDDEPDARGLIERLLKQHGAEITTAEDAAEGLSRLQSWRPDVLISDIGMPVQDGYRFIQEIRRLPAASGGQTPAIALTAFARSEDRTKAMVAGFQMHVAKPVEPAELLAVVGSLAGRIRS